MSKSTSRRRASEIDWQALLAAAEDESGITPEAQALWLKGRWSDPRPPWGRDYVHALQRALEQRKPGDLLALLDGAVPIPELLLPVVAEVLRDLKNGYATGRGSSLTALDDATIRSAFDRFRSFDAMKVGELHLHLADIKQVSVDTIKRSLARTKPRK